MLYERWRALVTERRNEIALRDAATGRSWTFAALHTASGAGAVTHGQIVYPRERFPEFLYDILGAWRAGKIVCPPEPGQSPPQVPAPAAPIVHLKLTSATTAAPRLVAFTAAQLCADVDNIVATMGLRPDWPNLGVISMAHSYGFSNLVLPLLLHGITLIHVASPLPEMLRCAADAATALTVPAVPAIWRAWHLAKAVPANVRLAISAGSPLPVNLEQEVFDSSGVKIHNFYGASECGGIAYDASEGPRTEDAFVGEPMRNVEASLSTEGCLIVHSKAAGETYWPESGETLGAGRFQTSDLAELKDGTIYLRGRKSDLINVAGRKVSPETIERALRTHPQVRDCLVFGAPSEDSERTEIIVAVVVQNGKEAGLTQFLQEILPAWQVPRVWLTVESLSANERGKISRAEWRRRYLELKAG